MLCNGKGIGEWAREITLSMQIHKREETQRILDGYWTSGQKDVGENEQSEDRSPTQQKALKSTLW